MTLRKNVLILAIGTVVIVGVIAGYFLGHVTSPVGIACTMEAKLCPDGSYVGRSGPKCEFAPCPSAVGGTETAFGKPITLQVHESRTFSGGMKVTLKSINDSRCKKGVVCVWAGELAAVLEVSVGDTTEEVRLGTTTKPIATVLGHEFRLESITETSATISLNL